MRPIEPLVVLLLRVLLVLPAVPFWNVLSARLFLETPLVSESSRTD